MPPIGIMPSTESRIKKIAKRDGRLEDFDVNKICTAITKSAKEVGETKLEIADEVAQGILQTLEQKSKNTTTIEEVNDLLENMLMRGGHAKIAKAYILYRHKKEELRKQKLQFEGVKMEDNANFSPEAVAILERRYLLKDKEGNTTETPRGMLKRVAKNIAQADLLYKTKEEQVKEIEEKFYQMIYDLRFLPNSPTLMNAGTKTQQLSSCFVLPIEDTMSGIFGTLKDAAVIHQRGSGTGFSFSRIRPKGDPVGKNFGVAAGPVAFMRAYDAALETIKQGGVRPGANMAVLKIDHPDIIRFIESKRDTRSLHNFNISVAITDNFMRAVEEEREYYLTNPHSEKYCGKLRAKDVFAMITQNAWKTGDPGVIFIDEVNRKHPAKHLGEVETTNQCGEAPLLPNEGCVLGSINLAKFVNKEKKDVDWDSLKETVHLAVHFLDNVIDMNSYPTPEIEKQTKKTRKFGLGIMGFVDLLFMLRIKYDSESGLEFADTLMSFIKKAAYEKSEELAEKRGVCLAWKDSDHDKADRKMRNMTCLSISPTGTISILANASSGCEPLYAIAYQKTVMGNSEIIYFNKAFEETAKENGFFSVELMKNIARSGSIQEFREIPKEIREIFVTAQDISPEAHIKMQSTLQKHVDNSISKTINLPATAAIKDVEQVYLLAWKSKCKGITVYRDGSYEDQVMNAGE